VQGKKAARSSRMDFAGLKRGIFLFSEEVRPWWWREKGVGAFIGGGGGGKRNASPGFSN